jgi:hypothetical protein
VRKARNNSEIKKDRKYKIKENNRKGKGTEEIE